MQEIMGQPPRIQYFGVKEGCQEACNLIVREDLTDLIEIYKVNIIFFHSRGLGN